MSLVSDLKKIGFDEKKARVYTALMELGTAKANAIAKKADIERPTTYDILGKLSKEGLVSQFEKRGVKTYTIENPEKLRSNLREQEQHLNHLLPELRSLYGTSEIKPRIRFFEGTGGIKTALLDTLTSHEKILRGILSMTDLYTIPGKKFMDEYIKQRVERGYALHVIRSRPKEVDPRDWPTSLQEHRELRYAPPDMVFSMTTYFYDNKVALISTEKEQFGMIIESEEYSQNMRHLFSALWQISSPS